MAVQGRVAKTTPKVHASLFRFSLFFLKKKIINRAYNLFALALSFTPHGQV